MILMITEKRSQVDDITKAMGWKSIGRGESKGSYNNEDIFITCARGHILGLESPDKIVEGLGWGTVEKMTPIPKVFKKVSLKDPKGSKGMSPKQYLDRIKKYSKDAKTIIIAADPDREGDLIGWEIIEKLNYKGKVERLSLLHGMDKVGINKSFKEIINSEESRKSSISAEARERGDWAFILVTMAYTFFGRKGIFGSHLCSGEGKASVASLGRVQTPTLNMINERCEEIENFISKTHYNIKGDFKVGDQLIEANYKPEVTQDIIDKGFEWVHWEPVKSQDSNALDKPLFTGQKEVNAFIERLMNNKDKSYVKSYKAREKFKNPPSPFDLASINAEASKMFGCTNSKIQEAVESLYQKGFTSYPRTEEREIPESIYYSEERNTILDNLAETISEIKSQANYVKDIHTGKHDSIKAFKPKAFSSKPMSHYAIIPTAQKPNLSNMTDLERKVYSLIATRFILTLYPPAKINETTATIIVPTEDLLEHSESEFFAKAEIVIDPGYQSAFKEKDNKGGKLPDMKEGVLIPLDKAHKKEEKTKPPPYYNDSNIETAMKTIGRFIKDPNMRKFLKKTEGIGRPATRTNIVETLMDRNYTKRTKKGIIVTPLGKELLNVVPQWLSSPEMTAVWEGYLENIASAPSIEKSIQMRDKFIDKQYNDLSQMIRDLIDNNKGKVDMSSSSGGPTDKQLKFAERIAKNIGVELPEEARNDFSACSAFIEENKDKQTNPPTDNMLNLAKKIATENNIELPEECSKSFESCKKFLDDNMSKRKPSEKMVNFARSLMEQNNIEGKEGWEEDYNYVRETIDKYANK